MFRLWAERRGLWTISHLWLCFPLPCQGTGTVGYPDPSWCWCLEEAYSTWHLLLCDRTVREDMHFPPADYTSKVPIGCLLCLAGEQAKEKDEDPDWSRQHIDSTSLIPFNYSI